MEELSTRVEDVNVDLDGLRYATELEFTGVLFPDDPEKHSLLADDPIPLPERVMLNDTSRDLLGA